MSTNERAGILSAERLAEIRTDLGAGASTESPWDLARALLAHIDALTPRPGETALDAGKREALRALQRAGKLPAPAGSP